MITIECVDNGFIVTQGADADKSVFATSDETAAFVLHRCRIVAGIRDERKADNNKWAAEWGRADR